MKWRKTGLGLLHPANLGFKIVITTMSYFYSNIHLKYRVLGKCVLPRKLLTTVCYQTYNCCNFGLNWIELKGHEVQEINGKKKKKKKRICPKSANIFHLMHSITPPFCKCGYLQTIHIPLPIYSYSYSRGILLFAEHSTQYFVLPFYTMSINIQYLIISTITLKYL